MRHFGVTILENLRPRWNVAPSQTALTIRQTGLHAEPLLAKWGLPPASSKRSFLINARMETVAEKPTFRDAFAQTRCLIPATGWYEWSAPKQPWHIQFRDGGPMAMAGLLFLPAPAKSGRRDNDESPAGMSSTPAGPCHFVIVTSAAAGDLEKIHHRQPLILPQTAWQDWLTGTTAHAHRHLHAASSKLFNWYRVGPSVGKVAEDHPGLVTPLDDLALAAEGATRDQHASQGDLFG